VIYDTVRRHAVGSLFALLCACAGSGGRPTTTPDRPAPQPEPPAAATPAEAVRIGAILPVTGSSAFRQYGTLIREGIDVAMARHREAGGRAVELIVEDDGGDGARAATLAARLEERGAVAIIGPLQSAAVEQAVRGRTDPDLVIVSPTASERPRAAHAYSLNAEDTRGASALAEYAAKQGIRTVGILYPRGPEFEAQARAFADGIAKAGGRVASQVTYDPGTTTFSRPMQQLRSAGVRAIFIPATERDIRQLAPQLEYFGLGSVQVFGNDAWTSDDVLRSVQAKAIDGVIAATPLYKTSRAVAWDEFVGLYEAAQRRTLDNPYPALGYDATRLILHALPSGRVRRADVARAIDGTRNLRSATGVVSVDAGVVSREPFLVRIQNGRLVLITGPSN
jgi:branched-chain amino acid transport system substrate-binding protein